MTDQPIIEARDLRKTYRLGRVDVPVLKGVNLAVAPGERVAILGASGSGKSTMLHLLGGLDRPDRGAESRIAFRGTPLERMGSRALDRYRAHSVGFVFQFYHLLPELNVLRNVLIGAMIAHGRAGYARRRAELHERARDLLARFGLAERLRHRPAELSGGERQRVAIARGLINQPDLLLADEPTGNLDQHTGAQILDALDELSRDRAQTMILVTHDAQTARRADRVINLRDGVVATA